MRTRLLVTGLSLLFLSATAARADQPADRPPDEQGTAHFTPADQTKVPERYRLEPHTFAWRLKYEKSLPKGDVDVFHLTFPSPVVTDCPENNTVHAEYYRPREKGPFPCVIVLDITGGDQSVSRSISTVLAQKGVGALFVQMAYYGPRRPPGSSLRLLSVNYTHTMEAVRQTVLDIRRASAWMAARPEIDAERLGILGTSLGSFIGTLSAEMEPRLKRVVVLLGGGGLVDAYYDDPRAESLRKLWEKLGGSKESLVRAIAPADPITCAANLKDRRVLIIAGKRDEIVPPKASEALWVATGRQKIVWYDCTHYGAALYFIPAMGHILEHFRAE